MGVGSASLTWPKYEQILGWKGRFSDRFIVDMAFDSYVRRLDDHEWVLYKLRVGKNRVAGETRNCRAKSSSAFFSYSACIRQELSMH